MANITPIEREDYSQVYPPHRASNGIVYPIRTLCRLGDMDNLYKTFDAGTAENTRCSPGNVAKNFGFVA
jgi:hypothetical protein